MSEKKTISTLLEELQKTVNVRGMDGTIAVLVNGRQNLSPDKHIRFVLLTVLNQFSITIEQLLNEKTDASKYAKAFIIYYLRLDFKIEWVQIKELLALKNQSWLWELMNIVKNLKPKLPSDIQYCEIKKILDRAIREYKMNQ